MKTRKFHPFAALAALAATTAAATAAPGSLNPGFGTGGKVTANYGGSEIASAVASTPNGKFVVAGTTNVMGNVNVAVLRYNANGTLDTTFSGDGGVITDVGFASSDTATCVAVQQDGKILVGGFSDASGAKDFLLLRYNTDGTLDATFGTNGRVLYDHTTDEEGKAIAIQPDGKIVLTGTTHFGASPDFAIIRFNKDGSPDATFSSDGFTEFSMGGDDFASSVALQNDGKIVVAGYTNSNVNDFTVLRVLPDGSIDNSFDTDGKQSFALAGDDRASSVKIQPDGKILVGGYTFDGNEDFVVVRYNSNGTLDSPFGGGDGRAVRSFGAIDVASSMILQPDGKIIVAGHSNFNTDNDFAILRFLADGTLDTGFGTAGEVFTDIGTDTNDQGRAMTQLTDGRIVVVGTSGNDFAAASYNLFNRVDARIGKKSSADSGNNVYNTTGAGQSLNVSVPKGNGKKNSFVRIQNDGHESGAFTVQGTAGNGSFGVRYLNGSTNVTSSVVAGTFSTGTLASGASIVLKVEVTAKTSQANKTRNFSVVATGGGTTDTVVVKAKSK